MAFNGGFQWNGGLVFGLVGRIFSRLGSSIRPRSVISCLRAVNSFSDVIALL